MLYKDQNNALISAPNYTLFLVWWKEHLFHLDRVRGRPKISVVLCVRHPAALRLHTQTNFQFDLPLHWFKPQSPRIFPKDQTLLSRLERIIAPRGTSFKSQVRPCSFYYYQLCTRQTQWLVIFVSWTSNVFFIKRNLIQSI